MFLYTPRTVVSCSQRSANSKSSFHEYRSKFTSVRNPTGTQTTYRFDYLLVCWQPRWVRKNRLKFLDRSHYNTDFAKIKLQTIPITPKIRCPYPKPHQKGLSRRDSFFNAQWNETNTNRIIHRSIDMNSNWDSLLAEKHNFDILRIEFSCL